MVNDDDKVFFGVETKKNPISAEFVVVSNNDVL